MDREKLVAFGSVAKGVAISAVNALKKAAQEAIEDHKKEAKLDEQSVDDNFSKMTVEERAALLRSSVAQAEAVAYSLRKSGCSVDFDISRGGNINVSIEKKI